SGELPEATIEVLRQARLIYWWEDGLRGLHRDQSCWMLTGEGMRIVDDAANDVSRLLNERIARERLASPPPTSPERTRLNRPAYELLMAEDLAWLAKQPRTLERDHIEVIVRASVAAAYATPPASPEPIDTACPECGAHPGAMCRDGAGRLTTHDARE